MSWGGLNPALTAWRNGLMFRFPDKDAASDGARADALHSSASQHQPDGDGTVDAYDMDVNLFRGSPESGTAVERALVDALKADFQADRRARLWIHDRHICSIAIGPWQVRSYTGGNPHDKHVHWESQQAYEHDGRPWLYRATDALLSKMQRGQDVDIAEFFASVGRAVRNDTDATAADRANRNNFAASVRFAAGMNFTEQTGENMPHTLLGRIADATEGTEAAVKPPPPA